MEDQEPWQVVADLLEAMIVGDLPAPVSVMFFPSRPTMVLVEPDSFTAWLGALESDHAETRSWDTELYRHHYVRARLDGSPTVVRLSAAERLSVKVPA